ncbi:THUMP domain-containing protein 2 isoform X5 [Piliocolobus tephrosceles]|uniref:THUMP domain-containing protein 2 isoform X5 n=1 Tax=Piliocolobus tephrosceles TaxID=591936 RepID=UPI000C2AEA2A|nr:THUMP domain-containing protein 2 isoform X5 [Piliocolobus tephrosceles]
MSEARGEPGSGTGAGARFFCTAGRGLERFLMREVRARLAATEVEYISGKVFFTTCSDLNMLKKLKSAERLFLLIKKQFPLISSELGKVIGIAIMKHFGWKADLRNPKLEIFIHLNDVYSVVGIPVFRVPLASRAYIKTAGLRSTIAWAMASLADIKAGAFVLDPMCGLGTILLEAAKEWPDVYYVGADVSDSQLLGTWDNLKAAGLEDKIELLKVSVIELPLPSESVDIIISDIPFGKKFKLGKDIKSILQEMERVLHVGGTIVLLLSEDHRRYLTDCKGSSIPFNSKDSHTDEPGIKKCLNPEEKTGASKTVSTSFEARNHKFLDRMSPFGSLVPVECYKVSLGKTDAFICKYKKSHSSGL